MTATAAGQRDPRSIITPDAFEVSEELLGRPLAKPRSRLIALGIDLLVVGAITAVTRNFGILLGIVAAGFFLRAGFKRTPVRGSVFGRAMRFSVGCLGVWIAMVTLVVWASCGSDFRPDRSDAPSVADFQVEGPGGFLRVLGVLRRLSVFEDLASATTAEEAEAAGAQLVAAARDLGLEGEVLREFLVAAVPEDAPWADEADALFDRLLSTPADSGAEPTPESASDAAIANEVAGYTLDETLARYGSLMRGGATSEADAARLRALQTRLVGVVAGDTLATLEARIDALERTSAAQQEGLEEAVAALDRRATGGFLDWVRRTLDDTVFGFGWLTLYLTVFLSWWQGQTVGKKVMGIRVMRLDGEPITWWTAFERVGGYAAGLATGLLGFAQVYWDANRQAIHDRIVGTVVVIDGAERVTDWESAL